MRYSIGTDIGGTFTDCVIVDEEGAITTGKAPSTPPDFAVGFFAAMENAAQKLELTLPQLFSQSRLLVHATTAATNALVEKRGANVGLITTRGHGEAMPIMRGGGRSKGLEVDDLLYLPAMHKPAPIVPRDMVREVRERVDSKGRVVIALDDGEVRRAIAELLAAGAEALAVGFLWSFLEPSHEQRVRELIEQEAPGLFVSCSHEIAPQVGEYYRLVATVFNSYVGPLMSRYVGNIADGAIERGADRAPLFAQCIGGTVPVEEVQRKPLFTLDSGPVSGIVAATFLGDALGYPNVITADMGGTTFDVSVISDGTPTRRDGTTIDRYHMYLPMLDVESIGAGGGSIAWLDPKSGTMKVGPQSAGADPGPICYQRGGTAPTVTDADVVLGVVNPDAFLGGRRRLDADAARAGIAELGGALAMSPEETAAGISEIIDNMMADKIRRMTVYRGHDPRNFAVFAFGGGGPTHASGFSAQLGVEEVVIPLGNTASVLSALGTVSGDVVHIYDRVTRLIAPLDIDALFAEFAELAAGATAQLRAEGFDDDAIGIERIVSMKYGAQVFDIEIPVEPGITSERLCEEFERTYERRFGEGSGYAPAGIEVIRLRVRSRGRIPRPRLPRQRLAGAGAEPVATRQVWWPQERGFVDTPVYRGDAGRLRDVEGPAIVELPDTTVPVRPGQTAGHDDHGNLVLRFPAARRDRVARSAHGTLTATS
ncbi:hydantoinase/oxoprolinase family protein [Conexibacter sp. CPCC 206217]|uniref:hydantoinase/oxoprolinase family protein n=1 Tax=Conexibacter sp. CPCC 206217 TaxID=3064574 RepID=UPI002728904B|nr:hydantoinase/oxoprolinase family protein [Conexibacter sp. CPCC 206217]MDO8210102.1 hydantoinase/oxoprolinase family protein [Conexibacter sp. CPCC 206217]